MTKELQHNLHVLHPFAIIRCNWDSWRGMFFFFLLWKYQERSCSSSNRYRKKSYRRDTRPGHCYSTNTVSRYHTSGLNWGSARAVHVSNPLYSNVKPTLLSCQTTLFDVDLQGCAHGGHYWHLSEEARAYSLTIKTVLITVLLISYNGDTCGIYTIV